ncbi:bifunctional N-acetylglucosamine-1-phosphate uridyltransferase/glucosamine-1-phosphate acetyltransferase [Candidatus Fermentibacterales bacterium]|nr:bifunctional N-acetylglucosamine-1-phosphate uridyltransferase/glucosamine-1-phosphate acetyltransferase [Candidatus Fermentibacterales bacterium]
MSEAAPVLCVILAAGKGKRMHSALPKVAHEVLGKPMIGRVVESARSAGLQDILAVIGHGKEALLPLLASLRVPWVTQERQLGTADALRVAIEDRSYSEVLVLLGDVPLLTAGIIRKLVEERRSADAAVTVLTSVPPDPSGYGRIVSENGDIVRIVEERDAGERERCIGEINTGLMCFDGDPLEGLLAQVAKDNSQGEFYLTDTISIARSTGLRCTGVPATDWREVMGVNDFEQLAEATEHLRKLVIRAHMERGVCFADPGGCWVEEGVMIGRNVTVGRLVRLSGRSVIGDGCVLGDGCIVHDSTLEDGEVLAPFSVLGPSTGGRSG